MDKDVWGNKQTNRLYTNKSQIPKHHTTGAKITGWGGNMRQSRQRNVVQMDICLKLTKLCKAKILPETVTKIAYDISELRTNPGKLTKYSHENAGNKQKHHPNRNKQITGRARSSNAKYNNENVSNQKRAN